MAGGREDENGTCGGGGGNVRGMSCKSGTMEEERSGEGLNEFSDLSMGPSKSI